MSSDDKMIDIGQQANEIQAGITKDSMRSEEAGSMRSEPGMPEGSTSAGPRRLQWEGGSLIVKLQRVDCCMRERGTHREPRISRESCSARRGKCSRVICGKI